jgi:hypothetical protein
MYLDGRWLPAHARDKIVSGGLDFDLDLKDILLVNWSTHQARRRRLTSASDVPYGTRNKTVACTGVKTRLVGLQHEEYLVMRLRRVSHEPNVAERDM